jgi:exopolysaccharide biosynthesis polyprenyl glycosylphosphotransferase
MLKQQAKLFRNLAILADLILLLVAFFTAYYMRGHLAGSLSRPLHGYLWVLLVVLPVWFFLLSKAGFYSSVRKISSFELTYRLFNVHLMGGALGASIIYLVDNKGFSRGLYLTFLASSFILLSLEKIALRKGLGWLRRRGYNSLNLLIVGTREKAMRFHELVDQHTDWGLKVLGFLQVVEGTFPQDISGRPVLGHAQDLVEICKQHPVDEVVFCLPKDYLVDAEEYLRDLEELGITVRMVLDFFDVRRSRRELSFFHDELPILTFHTKSFDAGQLLLKRCLDILGALVGLLITALLFPFIAFAIKKNDPGPIFFGHQRVGISGRSFKCWKFRSMYIDAEERKKELMAQNEMKGAIFKIKNDPRITPVGHFLRKTSLDELPQFWNVLKGEMSLVGTRPPTPGEVSEYENWHRRRISIRPGITGIWQVSGRNGIEDFDEIVRLDLKYIDEWNLWLDLRILFRTVAVVFAREGSC